MLSGQTYRTRTAPAPPPMDFDRIKPEARETLAYIIGGSTGLLVAVLALFGVVWLQPQPHMPITGVQWVGLLFFLVVSALGVMLGWWAVRTPLEREALYKSMVRDWHEQTLEERLQNGGQVEERSIDAWTLRVDEPAMALAVALATHYRYLHGEPAPHTNASLQESDGWLGTTRLGQMTQRQAEEFGRLFDALGLVQGRQPRHAGRWTAQSYDDVVAVFAEKYTKVRP